MAIPCLDLSHSITDASHEDRGDSNLTQQRNRPIEIPNKRDTTPLFQFKLGYVAQSSLPRGFRAQPHTRRPNARATSDTRVRLALYHAAASKSCSRPRLLPLHAPLLPIHQHIHMQEPTPGGPSAGSRNASFRGDCAQLNAPG